MVHWPGHTTARITDAIIDVIDWYPTLLDPAGAAKPKHSLDGKSLVSLLKGEVDTVRDTLHMHVPVYNGSAGKPDVMNPFFQTPASVGFRGNYKYVRNYEPDRPDELFDLHADIGESRNIAEQHPELLEQMAKAMDQWLKENKAELPNPEFVPPAAQDKPKKRKGGKKKATGRQ